MGGVVTCVWMQGMRVVFLIKSVFHLSWTMKVLRLLGRKRTADPKKDCFLFYEAQA